MAEIHISIHSWPDTGYAALDVFMSGDADPAKAIPGLRQAFGAADVVVKTHIRGDAVAELKREAVVSRKSSSPSRLRSPKRAKVAA